MTRNRAIGVCIDCGRRVEPYEGYLVPRDPAKGKKQTARVRCLDDHSKAEAEAAEQRAAAEPEPERTPWWVDAA